MKIKRATIKNLKDVQKLNLILFKKEYKEYDKTLNCKWTLSKKGEEYFKNRITESDGCVLVACADEKVVGYLVGSLHDVRPGRILPIFAELENIFILDKYRNMKIGTKLCRSFFKWCKLKNVGRVRVIASAMNSRAIKFYKGNGFEEYDLILETDI
jgi:ribosomal protein S18 acetylase RimI-like enzyme